MDSADERPAVARSGVDVGVLSPHHVVLAEHAGFGCYCVEFKFGAQQPDAVGTIQQRLATAVWSGVGEDPVSPLLQNTSYLSLGVYPAFWWSGMGAVRPE